MARIMTVDMRSVVREIVLRHDPTHIGFTPDEYDPEVDLILGALDVVRSEDDLTASVHAIFVRMFNENIAGSRARYAPIASEIWRAFHPGTSPKIW